MDDRPTDTRERAQDLDIDPDAAPLPARIEPDERARVVPHESPRGIGQENVRVIVRYSEQVNELFDALAQAQAMDGYGDIEKSKTARVKIKQEKGGGEYSYSYETLRDVLDATRPMLAKCGVSTMQFPFPGERSMTIRTMLAHKSGQWLYNDLSAVIPMPDPQGVGSAISYLRRYALKSILGVAAEDEDDDGAKASRQPERQRPDPPRPAQRTSEQARAQAAASAPVAAAPAARAADDHVGTVSAVDDRGTGVIATLSTGYKVQCKDAELIKALRGYLSSGARVELSARPSSDPTKFAPVLEEITQQRA